MMDDEIMCWLGPQFGLGFWAWASILRTIIRRISSVVVFDHSSY